MNPSRRLINVIALGAAALVFLVGAVYALVRDVRYESRAIVVLTPIPSAPKGVPHALDAFGRTAVAGTYVEFLSSDEVKQAAHTKGVSLSVRLIPDTRVLSVSASSNDKRAVRPQLTAILAAAQRQQPTLRDVWDIRTLQSPSAPQEVGTSTPYVLVAAALLAWLIFASVRLLLGRRERTLEGEPSPHPILYVTDLIDGNELAAEGPARGRR